MTAKLFASQLDGREYPFELSRDEERIAQDNRLLVVYGASDDLCELEGFTREESGAPGLVCVIEALWCEEDGGPSWTYRTTAPHETFNIMEEGDVYCIGLVIQL